MQSKSLVDIIQLECLSQSSVLLKINTGAVEGKIWIQNGEVIDAEALGGARMHTTTSGVAQEVSSSRGWRQSSLPVAKSRKSNGYWRSVSLGPM